MSSTTSTASFNVTVTVLTYSVLIPGYGLAQGNLAEVTDWLTNGPARARRWADVIDGERTTHDVAWLATLPALVQAIVVADVSGGMAEHYGITR